VVLDAFHTFSGTTAYPNPIALSTAWWVPLLFASAYASLGTVYVVFRSRDRRPHPERSRAVLGFVMFALLYFASGFLPAANPVKLAVLVGGAALAWHFVDPTPASLATGLVGAIGGPLTEITLVHLGAFRHLQPDFAGIPMWLPALYFLAGPAAGPLARRLAGGPGAAPHVPAPARG
jgi:hypothetical protein